MLNFLGRHAAAAIALGVFIGLAVQPLAAATRPLLMPAVWAFLVLSMMRIEWDAIDAVLRQPFRLVLILLWLLIVAPLLMWGIVAETPLSDGVKTALVLAAGSSPLMSTPAIGIILGLDAALILSVLVAATMLIPITLPLIALALLGLHLETDVMDLMWRLGLLVGSAAIIAAIFRKIVGAGRIDSEATAWDGVSVVLLWLFAIPLMDGITARLFAEPERMLFLIGISFAVYIGLMLTAGLVFSLIWRDRSVAWSVGLTSGCRNLAIIIAALSEDVDPEIMVYFALAQFPIYTMPVLLNSTVGRYLRNGPKPPISNAGGET